jgi:hypothetical protein
MAATGMSLTRRWMSRARRWMSSMLPFAICVLTPGPLLTATSVVVSFLGTRALTSSHLRVLAFIGLGAFVGSLVLCLYVLLPTTKIESLGQGRDLLGMDLDARDRATDVYERLVATYDDLCTANWPHVQRLGRVFRVACAAIVLEVVLWALQLAVS